MSEVQVHRSFKNMFGSVARRRISSASYNLVSNVLRVVFFRFILTDCIRTFLNIFTLLFSIRPGRLSICCRAENLCSSISARLFEVQRLKDPWKTEHPFLSGRKEMPRNELNAYFRLTPTCVENRLVKHCMFKLKTLMSSNTSVHYYVVVCT